MVHVLTWAWERINMPLSFSEIHLFQQFKLEKVKNIQSSNRTKKKFLDAIKRSNFGHET